jgi:hypothetical protein
MKPIYLILYGIAGMLSALVFAWLLSLLHAAAIWQVLVIALGGVDGMFTGVLCWSAAIGDRGRE